MATTPRNTLDFDAAKHQRLSQLAKRGPAVLPPTLLELRQHLNQILQTSLELERILGLFLQEVQRLVPLDALDYQHPAAEIRLTFGAPAPHQVSYQLQHAGEQHGALSFQRERRFNELELGQLESLLASLIFPLRNALLYRAAVHSALRDALTGAGNRVAMDQALEREILLAQRSLQPLSVLMLDIDHFKSINDTYGHSIGDQVLRAVAGELKAQLRTVDMMFRYGGEEFVVLLSSTASAPAALVGERLRQAIQGWHYAQQPALRLSISLGCAELQSGESASHLLHRADAALYLAKRGGRNRLHNSN
jgi:diguanylate cyclase (GGDEF)-like protein